jgi:hypothetical protein
MTTLNAEGVPEDPVAHGRANDGAMTTLNAEGVPENNEPKEYHSLGSSLVQAVSDLSHDPPGSSYFSSASTI